MEKGQNYRLRHDLRLIEHKCDHCGKWHTEGWIISEFNAHACSDECALQIYKANGQDKEEFEYDVDYDLSAWGETIF